VGYLEGGNCLFARYGRKRVEEFVETVTPLEIVNQVSEGNTSADENRGTAKYIGIAMNDGRRGRHPQILLHHDGFWP
jgi:hypothetical protein